VELTFYVTAFIPVILKIVEVIQKLKHTHTHTHAHTHMHTPYAACKLFSTCKIGWYNENEIEFALCY